MTTKPRHWASPRNIAIASAGCVLAGVIACGSDEPIGSKIGPAESGGSVISAAGAPSLAVAPSHGGTMVMAGTYPVEVVPHASGQVYAYAPEDALPPDGTELSVVVPVSGGTRTVALEWDAGDRRWAGRVRRVEIVPGPLEVVVVTGETRWIGHAVTLVVQPAIVVVTPPSPVGVVVTPPSPVGVVVVEHEYEYEYRGKHRKHRKHRGRGRGRGHGRHGGGDVEIRFGH